MTKTRILVVDDSLLIRQVLVQIFSEVPDFEVVGQARDGSEAVRLSAELKPDVITMDVEMPRLNGLEALKQIMAERPTPVLMVSTTTTAGAQNTLAALEAGAYDFVGKPSNSQPHQLRALRDEIVEKVKHAKFVRLHLHTQRPKITTATMPSRVGNKIVVVASSTGGPKALTAFFSSLPKGLQVPILVVQHMPEGFTASLAARLESLGTMLVREGKPGDRLENGVAYIAPGSHHMRVDNKGNLRFDLEPKIHGVRPAADHLFMSAAAAYGNRIVGVVLTGMGKDGAAGALAIKKAGGVVFGESAETCTVYGMPKAALDTGAISAEFPIEKIGQAVVAALKGEKQNVA